MSLAKHFFTKLRDSQQTLPCMVSCINSGVLFKINHLLLEIFRWNLDVSCYCCWWVVACSWLALLLLVQLQALVLLLLNACLPFSSWACCWLPAPSPPGMDLELQVLLHGFVGWWSSVFVVLCARIVVFLSWSCAGRVWAACSGRAHLQQLLAQLGCCGAANNSFSVLWLSCLCAVCLYASRCWSDPPPGRAVKLFGTQVLCTPVIKRTDTILGQLHSMMRMALYLPKSESNI
jgi:hypothetical protein